MNPQDIIPIDLNKVELTGRVVSQPELRIIPPGATLYVMMVLSIRAIWPDYQGEAMPLTYDIPCFAQGATAEALLWIADGDTVNIQGSLDVIVGDGIPEDLTGGYQLAIRIHAARRLMAAES